MKIRAGKRARAARADYLGGDPAEGGPINDGRLGFDSTGLSFTGPAGAELRLPVDGLLGISISGRAAERRRRRRPKRGTMRVAGLRQDEPTEWLFAIDRTAATALRTRVDQELASRGRDPISFVEELDGFPLHRQPASGGPEPEGRPSPELSIAELGHRLDSAAGQKGSRRRRILPFLLGAVLIVVGVIAPVVLLAVS